MANKVNRKVNLKICKPYIKIIKVGKSLLNKIYMQIV